MHIAYKRAIDKIKEEVNKSVDDLSIISNKYEFKAKMEDIIKDVLIEENLNVSYEVSIDNIDMTADTIIFEFVIINNMFIPLERYSIYMVINKF